MSTLLNTRSVPVVGNGSLGIVDSATPPGKIRLMTQVGNVGQNQFDTVQPIGTGVGALSGAAGSIGVSTNKNASGLIASLDDLGIGEITSLKLGKYILKY